MNLAFKIIFVLSLFAAGNLSGQNDSINRADSIGQKQGKWVVYDTILKTTSIAYYKDNKPDSIYRSYYKGGQQEWEITFKNGKREGTATCYHPNGKIQFLEFYHDDVITWKGVYDREGYMAMEEIFRDGKCISVIHYEKGKYITRGTPASK